MINMTLLLTGCVQHGTVTGPAAPETEAADMQTLTEKQLVFLFQTLMQMDKRDGLAITRSQAQQLLPIIRKNSTEGELTSADQKKIMDLLSPAQKQAYDDYQERMRKRIQSLDKDKSRLDELSESDRDRIINEFKQRRTDKENELSEPPMPPPRKPGFDELSGKNVEQQLIELLEARAAK
ncbi:hypothetical protein [Paenibacillus thalictri]|nr:hypothetical protein [Paenibacillus thalictri]